MKKVKNSLGFEGMVAVDCQGHSGGVALLWRHSHEVSLNSFSFNHIDVVVNVQSWCKYRLAGIYGEPNRTRRRATWSLIRHLAVDNNLPWCLIGDMNNVLGQADKRGGRLYPRWLIQGFQEVLDDCELIDMDLHGYPYIWERGRGTDAWIEIRLDRALASKSWIENFVDARLTNLDISTSDHCPVILEPKTEKLRVNLKRFRFENAWLREPLCKKIVEEYWEYNQTENLHNKQSRCAKLLSEWGQDVTGSFSKRISQCKKILKNTKGRRDEASVNQFKEES